MYSAAARASSSKRVRSSLAGRSLFITRSFLGEQGSSLHLDLVVPPCQARPGIQNMHVAHHLGGGAGDVIVDMAHLAFGQARASLAERLLQVRLVHREA